MSSLWLAVQFLTILPTPARSITPALLGRSLGWYPLVGALIGLVVGGVWLGLAWLGFGPLVSAAVALAAGIGLTGGLHLDGLLDTCDGALARGTPERRLDLMRDPRIGSYAFAGGACVLLIKVTALASLPGDRVLAILVATCALSRLAMVAAAITIKPARSDGLAATVTASAGRRDLALALAIGFGAAVLALGGIGVSLTLVAAIAALALVRWLLTRVPGMTGDTLGAINEVVEAVLLAAASWPGWWQPAIG